MVIGTLRPVGLNRLAPYGCDEDAEVINLTGRQFGASVRGRKKLLTALNSYVEPRYSLPHIITYG